MLGAATSSIVGVIWRFDFIAWYPIDSATGRSESLIQQTTSSHLRYTTGFAGRKAVAPTRIANRRQLSPAQEKQSMPQAHRLKNNVNPPDEFTSEALAAELDEPEALDDGIPTHIFTPEGVSGRMADELTMQLTERICRALAVMAIKKQSQTLIVCCDGKPTSEKLRATVVKTLLASGRDVVDLGRAPAPLMYFATHETEYDSGVLIGSETGPNGASLRIVLQGNMLGSSSSYWKPFAMGDGSRRWADHKLDMADHYLDRLALDVGTSAPLQVVLDGNFGAAAELANDALNLLGCEVISYNNAKGGTPVTGQNIHSALEALGSEVTKQGADLGLLFDGDSDRLHVVTNEGQAVAPIG